ncbi:MAG: 4Fe-4S binding protein, partial [Bacillota bacterium]|nr:4Fe-4S binding protein [Bacillota bacterium]
MTKEKKGFIFDIQHFSINDGPGIRTTVFLKGCPLRCAWCHNPESQSKKAELAFYPERCIGCGNCVNACPNGCHVLSQNRHQLCRSNC